MTGRSRRRGPASARPQLGAKERPPAIDRAVNVVRDGIPPPPPGIDERVLGAIRAECEARTAPRRARRHIRRQGLWLMAAASFLFLFLGVMPSLPPAPEPEQAVASVPLSPNCGTTSGRTHVTARQRDDRTQRTQPLVVAGPWTGNEATAFTTVLKRFSEKTGVRVVYAYKTREIAETLRTRLSRECPPDVALLPQPGLLRELAEDGHLEPVEPSTRQLVDRNLGTFWRRQASLNGRLYGVWFKAANKSTFWHSRRLFDAAGITAPATWTELRRAAATLRARGTVPFSVAGAAGWTLTDWFENVYLQTAGKHRYDALATQRLAWTDESVRTALRRLSQIFRRSWLAGASGGALMKTSFEDSVNRVFSARPTAAMVYEGDFVASHIDAAQAGDAGVFPFPAIAGSEPSVVVGGDVAALLTDDRDGQRLVRFLATVEAARLWARSGGISPNRRLDPQAYPNPTTRRLAQALVEAKTKRFDLSDLQPPAFGATPGRGMPKILQNYLSGVADIDTVRRELQAAAHGAGN